MDIHTVTIRDVTDADKGHRPPNDAWTAVLNPTIYLEKLALLWLKDRGQRIDPGVTYTLDRLPDGYVLYQRPRPSNEKIIDRHLYGSSRRRFFDSPNRFYPHFRHLMETGTNQGCLCTICASPTSQPLPISGPAKSKPGRPSKPGAPPRLSVSSYVDIEGVQDKLRDLLVKFQRNGRLDEEFLEPLSLDWHVERKRLSKMLQGLPDQASYRPRQGEVVLFVRELETHQEICREGQSLQYKVYDTSLQTFLQSPAWEAGIVSQIPAEKTGMTDLLEQGRKKMNMTYSGFRIEPLAKYTPGPGFIYVPLHHLRPFVFWEEYLSGIPISERHSSIALGLTHMASFNLVEKYRIKGVWPKATLSSKGLYLGSELIVVGDAVRLKDIASQEQHTVADVLEVTHITTEFLFDQTAASQSSLGSYQSSIAVHGHLFSTDPRKACAGHSQPVASGEMSSRPQGMAGYRWYRSLPISKYCKVGLHKILGRNFESDAMMLWFPAGEAEGEGYPETLLSRGLHGVRRARRYAKKRDARIAVGSSFFWANSRGEALQLKELNNVPLAEFDEDRIDSLEERSDAARALARASAAASAVAPPLSTQFKPRPHAVQRDTRAHLQDTQSPAAAAQSFFLAIPRSPDTDIAEEDIEGDMRARFGLNQARKRSTSAAKGNNDNEDDAETVSKSTQRGESDRRERHFHLAEDEDVMVIDD